MPAGGQHVRAERRARRRDPVARGHLCDPYDEYPLRADELPQPLPPEPLPPIDAQLNSVTTIRP